MMEAIRSSETSVLGRATSTLRFYRSVL
jgi:hypothetical protein